MCCCADIRIYLHGTHIFFIFCRVLCDGVQLSCSKRLDDHFVKEFFLYLKTGLLVPQ
jgi:hypothetical protein